MTSKRLRRVGVFSRRLGLLPGLSSFLACEQLVFSPAARQARSLDAVVGWGHKPTARKARDYAERHGLAYLALEDGFLRSLGLSSSERTLSLVVDDCGIYYDAHQPSRLEQLLSATGDDDPLLSPELLARARQCIARIAETGVSKYNHAPDQLPPELAEGEPYVLVVDQTFDDASVTLGQGDAATFERMLEAAASENPGSRVVVKVHPATVAGLKRGYLAERSLPPTVQVVAHDISPGALLRRAHKAYVCTSQLGFEALLARVPVTCFGAPFYSGWGLTTDHQHVARRTRRRSLEELVAAALLLYPRYLHPLTGERCEAEEVLEHLALHRKLFAENSRRFVCFGFSAWKRPFVRRYLQSPGSEVRFVRGPERVTSALASDPRLTAVVWASRSSHELESWARRQGIPLWNMEDGFLRSVGLGSDLTAPGSLVLDHDGIYYDPHSPSGLERILESSEFTPEELGRAARLRERIVRSGISKYNPFGRAPLQLAAAPGQRIVLVPGQVQDDASVRRGSPVIRGNESLLRAVREACPEAYIVYKPHPDVLRGNRAGAIHGAHGAEKLWDELVLEVPIAECFRAVHEVHTMTSLVGFEALLRGLPVVAHGQPFYAGWGLTTDRAPLARRTRRLSLDELVAGTLLRYPRYYDFSAHRFCTAEDKVAELERQSARARSALVHLPKVAVKVQSLAIAAIEWAREQKEWMRAR